MKTILVADSNATKEVILPCPDCGYKNKLSELVWDEDEVKCMGKNCTWKITISFEFKNGTNIISIMWEK